MVGTGVPSVSFCSCRHPLCRNYRCCHPIRCIPCSWNRHRSWCSLPPSSMVMAPQPSCASCRCCHHYRWACTISSLRHTVLCPYSPSPPRSVRVSDNIDEISIVCNECSLCFVYLTDLSVSSRHISPPFLAISVTLMPGLSDLICSRVSFSHSMKAVVARFGLLSSLSFFLRGFCYWWCEIKLLLEFFGRILYVLE